MDAVPYCWNKAGSPKSQKPRPTADAFTRLAKLMALVEHKQEQHVQKPSKPTSAKCDQEFLAVTSVVSHQQKGHSLHKRIICYPFDLDCQDYRLQPSVLIHTRPDCALPLQPHIPTDTPTPASASLPTSSSTSTCNICHKTLRSKAGLACHRRKVHQETWKKLKQKTVTEIEPKQKGLFPCRSCDRVFSNTSKLYLHRREEHRRDLPIGKTQKRFIKSTRRRQKGETYPCLHCGKVFLHHLTRWAHFKSYSNHYQTHLKKSEASDQDQNSSKELKDTILEKTAKESRFGYKRVGEVNNDVAESQVDEDMLEKPDAVGDENEREFPCPSCTGVFSTLAALLEHEEIHQPSSPSDHCSVCTEGIILPKSAEEFLNKVYHCIPCGEAFLDLVSFFQHCQTHTSQTDDEDDDDDDDDEDDVSEYDYVEYNGDDYDIDDDDFLSDF